MPRQVPEQYSIGGDKHNAQKAWLDGYDTARREQPVGNANEQMRLFGQAPDREEVESLKALLRLWLHPGTNLPVEETAKVLGEPNPMVCTCLFTAGQDVTCPIHGAHPNG